LAVISEQHDELTITKINYNTIQLAQLDYFSQLAHTNTKR